MWHNNIHLSIKKSTEIKVQNTAHTRKHKIIGHKTALVLKMSLNSDYEVGIFVWSLSRIEGELVLCVVRQPLCGEVNVLRGEQE